MFCVLGRCCYFLVCTNGVCSIILQEGCILLPIEYLFMYHLKSRSNSASMYSTTINKLYQWYVRVDDCWCNRRDQLKYVDTKNVILSQKSKKPEVCKEEEIACAWKHCINIEPTEKKVANTHMKTSVGFLCCYQYLKQLNL